jgi:hypothetical protein
MDYFERLGTALEHAWSERNREEERFPTAALEVLEGGGPERALAELRATYGAEAVTEHEADVLAFCEASLFSVLREDPGRVGEGS